MEVTFPPACPTLITELPARGSGTGILFVANPLDLGIVEPSDFMPDANALAAYYKARTNEELLNLKREGGFTDEAREIFESELARRKLTTRDLKRYVTDSEHRKLVDEARERGGGYQMPGLRFFGRRYLTEADEKANIQLRTKWFTLSGIPLIPIASYRFDCNGISGQQMVIERVPLNWGQVLITWFKTAMVATGIVLVMFGYIWYLEHGKR